jgi:long-chain acyl-CoA synthetase
MSGTTGPPKGGAYIATGSAWGEDTVLGIAPLYHVTGLSGHIGLALAAGASLVLAHRFGPGGAGQADGAARRHCHDHRVHRDPQRRCAAAHDLSSLRRTYSGGAPIAARRRGRRRAHRDGDPARLRVDRDHAPDASSAA